jgi:hypothetical protein
MKVSQGTVSDLHVETHRPSPSELAWTFCTVMAFSVICAIAGP